TFAPLVRDRTDLVVQLAGQQFKVGGQAVQRLVAEETDIAHIDLEQPSAHCDRGASRRSRQRDVGDAALFQPSQQLGLQELGLRKDIPGKIADLLALQRFQFLDLLVPFFLIVGLLVEYLIAPRIIGQFERPHLARERKCRCFELGGRHVGARRRGCRDRRRAFAGCLVATLRRGRLAWRSGSVTGRRRCGDVVLGGGGVGRLGVGRCGLRTGPLRRERRRDPRRGGSLGSRSLKVPEDSSGGDDETYNDRGQRTGLDLHARSILQCYNNTVSKQRKTDQRQDRARKSLHTIP